jgi:hypothetical protein
VIVIEKTKTLFFLHAIEKRDRKMKRTLRTVAKILSVAGESATPACYGIQLPVLPPTP